MSQKVLLLFSKKKFLRKKKFFLKTLDCAIDLQIKFDRKKLIQSRFEKEKNPENMKHKTKEIVNLSSFESTLMFQSIFQGFFLSEKILL